MHSDAPLTSGSFEKWAACWGVLFALGVVLAALLGIVSFWPLTLRAGLLGLGAIAIVALLLTVAIALGGALVRRAFRRSG
jgi:hypothetical protein